MNILLIEDDVKLSKDLARQLSSENLHVDTVFDGVLAERMLLHKEYDCILLDINIPGKNGYDLAKEIRKRQINTPIIMLTAYSELDDKLFGFENGADDYLTKPFFFKELLARIKAIIKRTENNLSENTIIADLTVDHRKRKIYRNGLLIKLTPREFEIIEILVKACGSPISKIQLLQKVWGTNYAANSNTIEVFINMLRNKIDKDFDNKLIKTRVGYGYYLDGN